VTWDPDQDRSTPEGRAPSCPTCGTRDLIERLAHPIDGRPFWCGTCNTAFSGSTAEWERSRSRRDRFAAGFYQFKGWPEIHPHTEEEPYVVHTPDRG